MGQASIEGNQAKTTVKTNDPKLDDPNFAGLGLWSTQFAQTVLNVVFGTPTQQSSGVDGVSGGDSLLEALQFRQQAMKIYAEEEGIEFPEGGGPVQGAQAAVGAEGNVTVEVSSTATATNSAFIEWLTDLKKLASQEPVFMGSETMQLLSAMHSSDEATVYTELVSLAKISTLSVTAEQKMVIEAKLQVLAKAIAEKNAVGGSFVLNLTIPVVMLAVFAETIGLSTDSTTSKATKEALYAALSNITTALGTANYESLIHQKPADLTFLDLISEDPQRAGAALSALTAGYTPPEGVSTSDVSAALSFIANTIATLKTKDRKTLQSVDREGLTELFTQTLEAAAAAGTISPAVKTELLATLVPLIVDKMYDLNYTELTEGLRSPSVETIRNSLVTLTGVDTDKRLSHTTRTVAKSYIQALIDMLGFMAQVRAFITMSQGQMSEALAQAKIASVTDEVNLSMKVYEAELKKIQAEYKDTCSKIDYANMMRMLMPLISIFMAVAMLIVSVVSLVSSVLSFGAAAAPSAAMVAGLISAIIGVVSSAVSVVLTCVDSGLQMAGKESMWVQLANACGITDSAEQSAFIAGFQFLIQLITVIATCGVAFGLTAGKAAAQEAVAQVEKAVEGAAEEAVEKEGGKAASKELVEKAATTGVEIGKGAGEVGRTAGSTVAKAVIGEVGEEAAKEAAEKGTYKLAFQQVKELGFRAAFKQGMRMSKLAFKEVGKDVMKDILKKIIFTEVVLGTVNTVLGSGLVTQGLIELGKLIFHNDRDAMIFAIVMTAAVMVVTMAAAAKISSKFGASKGVGQVEGAGSEANATGEVGDVVAELGDQASEASQKGTAAARQASEAAAESSAASEKAAAEAAKSAAEVPGGGTPTAAAEPGGGTPTAAPVSGQPVQAAPPAPAKTPQVEGQAAPPLPQAEATPSRAQEVPEEAPSKPSPEAEGGPEEAAPSEVPEMAQAPGEGGQLVEGSPQGTQDTETYSVKVQDPEKAVTSMTEKMRQVFIKVLNTILRALQKMSKETGEAAVTAAETGSVRGGWPALERQLQKLASKLAQFIKTLEQKSVAALASEAAQEAASVAQRKTSDQLREAIANFAKKVLQMLKETLGMEAKSGSEKFARASSSLAECVKLATTAIRIWSGVIQYKTKREQAKLHEMMAELDIDTSQLQAVMQLFNQMSGIDQTQTIQDLSDDTAKMFESWTGLLEMVSGFIEGAGGQVTELMMKANR
jgi:hypothetical protein